ncbi:uncharacterized protein LOC101235754 isoform X2 [Hydra vulgaris]|uniref:uncharacterized protein LOC101235754 isoform X2 n=1 Tax=Hydra vulgaris TaxID=6087 RepID=UPI001F5F20AE|nr:uncharacterized protein LOC101235754 isoform X2 [Hydra vulgaris]
MQKFSWHQMFFHLFLFAIGAVHTQTFNGSVPIESAILSWTQIFINDNPGLQFLNSNWNFNDFRYYVLQDGLYMKNYSHVYTRIPTLCSGQPNTNAFYNRLNKTLFNISEYENFFEIKYSSNDMIFSDVLNKYFEHYAQQQTCKDLVSAMLPCLCLYPTIINALIPNMDQFDPLVKKWIEFNKSSGTTCKIGQKGKKKFINEDFCLDTTQIRRTLKEKMKVEQSSGKYAVISYNRLIIRDWASNRKKN